MRLQRALQEIQERHGYLPKAELERLAERLDVPLHRLHELASCFPSYRLTPPAPVEVRVCRDMACHMREAEACRLAIEDLSRAIGGGQIVVNGASCLGQCDQAPAMLVNEKVFVHQDPESAQSLVDRILRDPHAAVSEAESDRSFAGWSLDPYHGEPTYEAARRYLAECDGHRLIEELKASDLRGMGGAGQWAHKKWLDVWQADGDQKYIVCNADESEPATFKDREILHRAPHLVIEGMLLAGLLTGARRGYVYIRHEYHAAIHIMQKAIARAKSDSVLGKNVLGSGRRFDLIVFVSPGGYICGEQGALIEALEDHRAEPRNRPPQLETNGLYDKPTLLSNVETFAWVPAITLNGGAWYSDLGQNGGQGKRLFSICGDVVRPGVYETPIGTTLADLIERAGGVIHGRALKAVAPSGPSGGFLPAQLPRAALPNRATRDWPDDRESLELTSLRLDIDEFRRYGQMLGAGLVVYADGRNMIDQALNASRFFRNESCGKCVPCRLGSQKLVNLAEHLMVERPVGHRLSEYEAQVGSLLTTLELTSICGLGMSAARPLASALQFFREDLWAPAAFDDTESFEVAL